MPRNENRCPAFDGPADQAVGEAVFKQPQLVRLFGIGKQGRRIIACAVRH